MTTSNRPEPEQLIVDARTADGSALGRLLELYRHYLRLLARLEIGRRLRKKVADSDLVQEVFLEAHRHFGQFRGTTEADLMGWLRQILAGVVANLLRRYDGTKRRNIRIILSHLESLAFPEVARRMGRSVDSVKNLWARA